MADDNSIINLRKQIDEISALLEIQPLSYIVNVSSDLSDALSEARTAMIDIISHQAIYDKINKLSNQMLKLQKSLHTHLEPVDNNIINSETLCDKCHTPIHNVSPEIMEGRQNAGQGYFTYPEKQMLSRPIYTCDCNICYVCCDVCHEFILSKFRLVNNKTLISASSATEKFGHCTMCNRIHCYTCLPNKYCIRLHDIYLMNKTNLGEKLYKDFETALQYEEKHQRLNELEKYVNFLEQESFGYLKSAKRECDN